MSVMGDRNSFLQWASASAEYWGSISLNPLEESVWLLETVPFCVKGVSHGILSLTIYEIFCIYIMLWKSNPYVILQYFISNTVFI